MRIEDIDWENPYEVWEYLMQPTVERLPNETDKHYKKRILKYMEDQMNEIEKMYENAGLSNMWVERYNDGYYEHERYYNSYKEMINNMMKANDWTRDEAIGVAKKECRKEHPPFTAEKQLAIFKMFCRRYLEVSQHVEENGDLCFGIKATVGDYAVGFNKDFAECLADFVNCLWQSLTEEERTQIKEILE